MTDFKIMSPEELNQKALAYFKKKGIDPNKEPANKRILTTAPVKFESASDSVTTHTCHIDVASFLFYTYVNCSYHSDAGNKWEFEGDSGGLGAGGAVGVGAIVYSDSSELHSTKDFAVAYGAEGGGAVVITWGKYGTATLVAAGGGGGAFAGTGDWTD